MSSANDDASTPPPPRELVVDARPAPGDASSGAGVTMAPIVVTVIVAGLLAKYVAPIAAGAALFAAVVFLLARRKPDLGRFVLRVENGGVLVVTREKAADDVVVARVALSDVIDVTLDKEAHASGRGASTVERVKIALKRRENAAPNDESILLPEARITPIEGQEWQAKVRVFLRKHGWEPIDERSSLG